VFEGRGRNFARQLISGSLSLKKKGAATGIYGFGGEPPDITPPIDLIGSRNGMSLDGGPSKSNEPSFHDWWWPTEEMPERTKRAKRYVHFTNW